MEVEVISSEDNKMLDRKEVNAVVQFEGATPSRKEIREAVSTKLGLNPDLTILNSVVNEFGVRKIRVMAHSYKNIKKLMEVEPEYLRKREGIGVEKKEEKPKEEAPKPEEKKPEAKEEKKEEKKEKPKEEKKPEKPKEEPKKEEKPKEEPKKEEKKPEPKKEEPKKEEKPKEEKKEEAKEEKK